MDKVLNSIQNKDLASIAAHAPRQVLASIQKAANRTGVNFAYLVQQASAESSFNPKAKAKTSSASGLYQFIESTWLSMVKKYGDKHGMGEYADKINAHGKVSSRAARNEILALRNDPEKASALAAEFANENKKFLEDNWGGEIGSTELYFAHFMGAGGAAAFLKARDANPMQEAALIFPKAAAANRNVFYDTRTGRPKTLDEVYAFFDKKFDVKDSTMPQVAQDALMVANAHADQSISAAELLGEGRKDSVVFNNGNGLRNHNYGSIYASQDLIASPFSLIMLGQMDLPIGKNTQNM
jgi:hypothetical protein